MSPGQTFCINSRGPGLAASRATSLARGGGSRFPNGAAANLLNLNLLARRQQLPGQAARDGADVFPSIGLPHGHNHGKQIVPNPRKAFTFAGKEHEQRV